MKLGTHTQGAQMFGEEILLEIDGTLDQLIRNAEVIQSADIKQLNESEIDAFQKTQESLLQHLINMDHPFSVPHDTLDPVAFTIQMDKIKIGICADVGHVTSLVRKMLEDCDYLYLEANHQPSMVHATNRPQSLKQRILGKQGHLSNEDCAHLLTQVFHPNLKHVYLSHLSGECNHEQVALNTVADILEKHQLKLNLSIAYQDKISEPIILDR